MKHPVLCEVAWWWAQGPSTVWPQHGWKSLTRPQSHPIMAGHSGQGFLPEDVSLLSVSHALSPSFSGSFPRSHPSGYQNNEVFLTSQCSQGLWLHLPRFWPTVTQSYFISKGILALGVSDLNQVCGLHTSSHLYVNLPKVLEGISEVSSSSSSQGLLSLVFYHPVQHNFWDGAS